MADWGYYGFYDNSDVPWHSNCSSIKTVNISEGVSSIGDKAFYNCSSLTSISIPDSITVIGSWAFYDCTSLTSITIPISVTTIGDSAFSSCENLTDVYYGSTEEDWNAIKTGTDNEPLTNATIHYTSAPTITDAIKGGEIDGKQTFYFDVTVNSGIHRGTSVLVEHNNKQITWKCPEGMDVLIEFTAIVRTTSLGEYLYGIVDKDSNALCSQKKFTLE